jgi:hypothetical protein
MAYPPIWGSDTWRMVHFMTYVYPDNPSKERQSNMNQWLHSLCPNLPCPSCSKHCVTYMITHPPAIESKQSLWRWGVDFHNNVNRRLGKRELDYSEAEQILKDRYLLKDHVLALQEDQFIRNEDHKYIKKLQDKLISLDRFYFIVVAILVFILFVSLIVSFILSRR